MNVTLHVARRELLDARRDGRLRWTAAVVLALLLAALGAGWLHTRDARRQTAAAQQLMREQWLAQRPKNPHSAAHFGIWAFRPTPPLAALDPGVLPYAGQAVWLEAHKQNDTRFRPARDATAVGRFGALTAAVVLQFLLPLLVILLGFGALSGERERGTLRLLLSLGVPRRSLLWGKALGTAGALAALVVPAAVVGAAALALGGGGRTDLAAVGGMAAGYALYLGTFVGLALAASALAASPRAALLALLGVWSASVLLVPRIAGDVARALHPTPSAAEFGEAVLADKRNGIDGHASAGARADAFRSDVLRRYNVSSVDSLPVNFDGLALIADEEYGARVYDRHYAALWAQFRRQERVHSLAAAASPLLAVRALSMGLAGTDAAGQRDFSVAAERYRRMMVGAMNDELTYRSTVRAYDANVRGPEVWARVADFAYVPPRFGVALARQRPALLALAAWCVGSLALAAAAAARLRPA